MPLPAVITLRMAVLYLIGGATLGAMVLTGKALPAYAQWITLFPLHIVWIAIGGFVQFTLGTAFWILPKFATGPSFYGNVRAFQWCIGALNVGVILYTVNFVVFQNDLLGLGVRVLWVIAAVAAGIHFFPRIKPFQHS